MQDDQCSKFIQADEAGFWLDQFDISTLVYFLPMYLRLEIFTELIETVRAAPYLYDTNAVEHELNLLIGIDEDGEIPPPDDPVTVLVRGSVLDGEELTIDRNHVWMLNNWVLPQLVELDESRYELRFSHPSFN